VRGILLFLSLVAGCGPPWHERAPGGLEPIAPGTAALSLLSAAACGGCHAGEVAEWRGSRHAQAWTNGIFRREYRTLPRTWCIHCHAPLAAQVAEAKAGGGPLADEGVGCAACHVRAGRIRATARRPGSPHDTIVDAGFGGTATCAGCHEFGFPIVDDDGEVRALTSHPMQATLTEVARGPYAHAEEGCRTCHAQTAHEHAYPGGHDAGMLARALELEVCRAGAEVTIGLRNRGAGHRVPTGDVHRHAVVRVWRSAAPERLYEVFIGRRFAPEQGGGKRVVWDSTLAPGEGRRWRVADADLGADGPLNWELRYVYTIDENPRRDPGEPTVTVVAEGTAGFAELPACAR
jgi:hypothetical protein